MKNLTLVLVLSMAAFAGCKKKGDDAPAAGSGSAGSGSAMAAGSGSAMAAGSGSAMAAGSGSAATTGMGALECAAALDHAMTLEKDEMKKEMPSMTDDQIAKLRDVAVKQCKEDKWDDTALHCFADGKTAPDVDKCDEKLTKDQKDKFNKAMEAAMSTVMAAGSGSGAAPAGGSLPKECQDYTAAMEKLAKCDKMPAATKDAMKQGFDAMKQGWAQLDGLPPEALKAMADGCKQGADALMTSGKALCGW